MGHVSSGKMTYSGEGYQQIPSSIVHADELYDFDIFMKVRDTYRLFVPRGAFFTGHHAAVLQEENISLYVMKSDWAKVDEYMSRSMKSVLKDPKVSAQDKAALAFSTSMKSIGQIGDSQESRTIQHMEPGAEHMVKCILSEEKVMDNLIWVSSHDHFTYQHSVRVGIYATALTLKLYSSKLSKNELFSLSEGYFLHDLGMARVPLSILDKRGALTPQEWKTIRMHPLWGHDRLQETGHLTPETAGIVLSHHERSDGSGYPNGLTGERIPVFARICALADVFESITAVRPYRRPKDTFNAFRIIQQEMSREFDQEMFKAFVLMMGPRK